MSNIHDEVRSKCAGSIVTSCRKGNCRLDTRDLPRDGTTIVDVDQYLVSLPEGEKKPDFFVFVTNGPTHAAVVEMKDGRAHAADAEQIQAGADQMDRLVEDFRGVEFLPLLVHQRIKPIERKALGRRKVRFRGTNYRVQTCRCGDSLSRQF
jgi:hypothetical protein